MRFEELMETYQDLNRIIDYSEISTRELIDICRLQIIAKKKLARLLLKMYEVMKDK